MQIILYNDITIDYNRLFVDIHVVVDFFNRINLIYGTVSEFCTESSCPVMSGGPKSVMYQTFSM